MSLSDTVSTGDSVVVTAVLAEPDGDCQPVQVLVAGSSVGDVQRILRRAGFKRVRLGRGGLKLHPEDAAVATGQPRCVFQRAWPGGGRWVIRGGELS